MLLHTIVFIIIRESKKSDNDAQRFRGLRMSSVDGHYRFLQRSLGGYHDQSPQHALSSSVQVHDMSVLYSGDPTKAGNEHHQKEILYGICY